MRYLILERQFQLEKILEEINKKPTGKFMVYGISGIGKTTFLRMVEHNLKSLGKKVIWVQRFPSEGWEKRYKDIDRVYIIDDLDEAYYQQHLVRRVVESSNCCICTSRKKWDFSVDFEITLEALSDNEVFNIVMNRLRSYDLSDNNLGKIISKIKEEGSNNPSYVVDVINSYFRESRLKSEFFSDFSEDICQSYTLGKGMDLTYPKIFLPDHNKIIIPKEIKKDIRIINKSLITQIAERPEILDSLTFRQFEEAVCELFEKNGYKVILTKQTHDGGKDLIILNHSLMGNLVFYAECKKFARTRPVGVDLVRQFYGTIAADRVTAGIFITSSYFSSDADTFARLYKPN